MYAVLPESSQDPSISTADGKIATSSVVALQMDSEYLVVITSKGAQIWAGGKSRVKLGELVRDEASLEECGHNVTGVWSSSRRQLAVLVWDDEGVGWAWYKEAWCTSHSKIGGPAPTLSVVHVLHPPFNHATRPLNKSNMQQLQSPCTQHTGGQWVLVALRNTCTTNHRPPCRWCISAQPCW